MTTLLRAFGCAVLAVLLVATSAVSAVSASESTGFDQAHGSMSSSAADGSAAEGLRPRSNGYDNAVNSGAATTVSGVGMEVLAGTGASGHVYDSSPNLVATNAIPRFDLHPRVLDQLDDVRMGPLQGQLTPDDLQGLINDASALRVVNASSGHISVIQEVDGVLLRITTAADEFKYDVLGDSADISRFDIYRDGSDVWLVEKSTGTLVPTYEVLPGG